MTEGGLRKRGISGSEGEVLLSVITVVFNGATSLEETLQSVIRFRPGNSLEHIVVDGGSTDGTVKILEKFSDAIDYWISEPDRGIYDALNKGISLAKGQYFFVLNIGDQLLDFPARELAEARTAHADVILFDVLHPGKNVFKSRIDYRSSFGNTIHHQGAFYRRSLNIQYDLAYRVYADFDINLKLIKQKRKFVKYDKVISYHSLDGISNNRKYRNEYLMVIKKNSGMLKLALGFLYIRQGEIRQKIKTILRNVFKGTNR